MDTFNSILERPLLILGEITITIGQVAGVLLFVLLGALTIIWSTRLLVRILHRKMASRDLVQLLGRAYLITGFILLALVTLDYLKIPLAAFAFISGAIAIGLGFGAQNIINNFISGWILMWERPIKIGDILELGDVLGKVESIDTRSTRLRRFDGVHVLVPNSQMLENSVTNWTHQDNMIRSSVVVGVAYGSDVSLVKKLLKRAAHECSDVLSEPESNVFFEDFGDSALIFEIVFWVSMSDERGPRVVRSDLRFRIDALLAEHGVVISFPQRDIHLDGSIELKRH